MKKTYISPDFLLVHISSKALIATSFNKNETSADEDVVLTKEYDPITDKNLWDDEW